MKCKNLFKALALSLIVVVTAFGATSCTLSIVHDHTYAEWETVTEPTCTSFGLQKRVCACGYIDYGTTSALEHTPVTDEAVSATCVTTGKTEGSHCGTCGAILTAQTETERISHDLLEWETVTEPTCTSFGLKKRACACGQAEYATVDALGHTVVTDEAVAATCVTAGKTEGSHCSACGVVISAQCEVAPVGHSLEMSVVEEALCNLDGTKRYSCKNEGCSYYYDESYSLLALTSEEIYTAASRYVGVFATYDRLGYFIRNISGFVIREDGVVVTSAPAFDNTHSAIFMIANENNELETYEVTGVLAYSEVTGLAVVKVDATDLPCATICTSELTAAETVYTVGAPDGLFPSISEGIISNPAAWVQGQVFIQHDADMSRGYAGGPLINRFGEVIGVNVMYTVESHVNLATYISGLRDLDYENPLSMQEYCDATYTPVEQLNDWIQICNNESSGSMVGYVIRGVGFYYCLAYNTVDDYSVVEARWETPDGYVYGGYVVLDNNNGVYNYYASLEGADGKNEVTGYLEAAGYNADTVLTYETYEGRYWDESDVMALHSRTIYDVLSYFAYCLDNYFLTATLESFGFDSLSYDRDEEALDKLNALIVDMGVYDETTGTYFMLTENPKGDDLAIIGFIYTPEKDDAPASTKLFIDYYVAAGSLWSATISLDTTDLGNYFKVFYAVQDGTDYVTQNSAWGYFNAAELTAISKLNFYVFDGMNDFEDALIRDYAALISHAMGWLNSVMNYISPELSVVDLGFLFYFE